MLNNIGATVMALTVAVLAWQFRQLATEDDMSPNDARIDIIANRHVRYTCSLAVGHGERGEGGVVGLLYTHATIKPWLPVHRHLDAGPPQPLPHLRLLPARLLSGTLGCLGSLLLLGNMPSAESAQLHHIGCSLHGQRTASSCNREAPPHLAAAPSLHNACPPHANS